MYKILHMKNLKLRITFIILAIFIVLNNIYFFPKNILSWDVFGYYLYLPMKFIYNDLGLNNFSIISSIIEKYHNTGTFYQAMQLSEGQFVMKYSMGLSFFYAPFFFIGHLIASLFNYPADGFSLPYQYSIFVGGIIYSIAGIFFLVKVLNHFFREKITAMILLLLVFATNYIPHITMYGQNAMSHNYLFFTYSLILWLTILLHKSYKFKYLIYLAVVCGLTILGRPSEIVCLLISMLWGVNNKETAYKKLKLVIKHKWQIIMFGLIILFIIAPQFIYFKIYTGKFMFNSYGGNAGEDFEFLTPYILEVLFSFRKGWLIYTPIMIFGIIGFIFLYRKNKYVFYALFIYFIFNLYIVSSWSCWWYAQSFSQRALIPSYPIMAISLGYFLTWLREKNRVIKYGVYTIIICFVCLNLFQITQFHKGILSADRMTKAYYFATFGKMYATDEDKKLLMINRSFDGLETFNNHNDYSSRVFKILDFENAEIKDSTLAFSQKYSYKMDSSNQYSPSIECPFYKITNGDHAWIKISAMVYPTKEKTSNPFSIVVHFNHNGYAYKYKTFDSENMNLNLNQWNKIIFYYLTPEVRKTSDILKVYVWLRGHNTLYIDDLQVDIFEKK